MHFQKQTSYGVYQGFILNIVNCDIGIFVSHLITFEVSNRFWHLYHYHQVKHVQMVDTLGSMSPFSHKQF